MFGKRILTSIYLQCENHRLSKVTYFHDNIIWLGHFHWESPFIHDFYLSESKTDPSNDVAYQHEKL